jgi:hypothetical protein
MKHPGHTYGGFILAISERGMTFWLALAKVGRGGPSWLMSAATSLAQVGALVKSILQLAPSPMWLFVCVAQSSRHQGLPARW